MAALEITKKLLIYHTLYRLNLSFSNIISRCRTLQEAGVFTARSAKLLQGYTQELQAEINQELLETMHEAELGDWARFGKVRQKREKQLLDPNDVFIHAKEWKEQLAKKQKKNQPK
jgi:hypothetical protein